MKRRELKKAIKKYAREIKFYKYGLISQLIKFKEKRHIALVNAIPKVKCPQCGSNLVDLEHSDSEYDSYTWLSCHDCGCDFDDLYGYADAIDELYCEPYFDTLQLEVEDMGGNVKYNHEWSLYCEEEIRKMLNSKI